MKRTVVVLTLTLILLLTPSHLKTAKRDNTGHLVLPNSKLLRCNSSNCFQLFSESIEQRAMAPRQVILDMRDGCIYGLTALYDKSVPIDLMKSGIDDVYKQWSVNDASDSKLYLWRVEPEKFGIQLSVTTKEDEKRNAVETGTRQVIYIAFGGRSACGGS